MNGQLDEAADELGSLLRDELNEKLKGVVLMNLATCYRLKGNTAAAHRALREADRLVPNHGYERQCLDYLSAMAASDDGEHKQAIRSLTHLIAQLDDRDTEQRGLLANVLIDLATLLFNDDDYATAAPLFERALSIELVPDLRQQCEYLLGSCYQHLSNDVAAEAHLLMAAKQGRNAAFRTRAHYLLGLISLYGGRFEEAKNYLEEAGHGCERGEFPCALVWSAMAMALEQLGDRLGAERYHQLAGRVS
jgi:tetratricopeptide (TPR) repeat protein